MMVWYIYTTEDCSAIKRNEVGPFAETWMDPEPVIQSEVSHKKRNKINSYMWNLEKWYR